MRVLLYNPGYTVDKDGQSLRVTRLASALAPRWQFDIITTPVFFSHHQVSWRDPDQAHDRLRHLRAFLTNPGAVATLRAKLHCSAALGGASRQGEVRPNLSRAILRGMNGRYNRVFGRIGDPDWILPAVLQGLRLLRFQPYQCVCSSASSYFVSHIAAAVVSHIGRVPLVLDYGDPWGPQPPARPGWLDRVSEAFALRRARRVIVTNDRARDVLLLHHPFLRRDRIAVIAQGYDEQSNHDDSLPHNAGPFTLVYTGNLYAGVQSSLEFLQALRLLASDGITVQILWAGSGLPTDEAERLNRVGASPVIQDLGRLPHHDALALQRKAAMLLVLGTRRSTNIPGKTIEYIGARRPILCLSEGPHDLAAKFVREHGLGVVVPNRTSDIVAALRDLHALWLKGQLDTIYHPADIERFSWRSLARDLEGILLEVIAQNAAQAVASTRDGGDGSVDYMAQARDE